jgi:uncharacterized SAM-binding protein YcdF (DUF218 family)
LKAFDWWGGTAMGTPQSWVKKTDKDLHLATAGPGRPTLEEYRSEIEHFKLLESMHSTYESINKEAGGSLLLEQLFLQPHHFICTYTFGKPVMNYQMALVVDESGPRLVFSLHKPARVSRHYAIQDFYQLVVHPGHHFLQSGYGLIKHQLRIFPAIVNNIDVQQWFAYLLNGFRPGYKPLEKHYPVPKFSPVSHRPCSSSGGVLSPRATDLPIETKAFSMPVNISSERITPASALRKPRASTQPLTVGRNAPKQTERTTSRKRFRGIWACRVVGVLTFLISFAVWMIMGIGHWLVISDPLQPAAAIVVLGGEVPYRAMEAAAIFRQGWAPEVWVTPDIDIDMENAFRRLGLHSAGGEEIDNAAVLNKLGVPLQAIRQLESARNSKEEILVIARELARQGGKRVIIVTSPPHTRREKMIWQSQVGDAAEAIVWYTATSPYDADHWWRTTEDGNAVVHEVLGILNLWAGFPVRQNRGRESPGTASQPKESVLNR